MLSWGCWYIQRNFSHKDFGDDVGDVVGVKTANLNLYQIMEGQISLIEQLKKEIERQTVFVSQIEELCLKSRAEL